LLGGRRQQSPKKQQQQSGRQPMGLFFYDLKHG
jgi:hypothetical protein